MRFVHRLIVRYRPGSVHRAGNATTGAGDVRIRRDGLQQFGLFATTATVQRAVLTAQCGQTVSKPQTTIVPGTKEAAQRRWAAPIDPHERSAVVIYGCIVLTTWKNRGWTLMFACFSAAPSFCWKN